MNIRLTILLVAILLLFGGTFLIVAFNQSPDQTPDQPWLYKIDDNSIVHIEVTYQGDTSVYDKKPGSTSWFIIEDGQQIPVFQDKWSGTPLLLSGPKVNRRLAEEMSNPSDFGLDPPESVIKVTERTGRTYEFHMGTVTPDEEYQYARLVGSPELFTVPQIWAMVINRLVFQPPYGRLYNLDESSVVYFEVSAQDKLLAYGNKISDESWYILEEDGGEVAVSPELWNDEYLLLNNPRVTEELAPRIEDPAEYGFDPPRVNVWLASTNGENHEFFLGNTTPDGQSRYATPLVVGDVSRLVTVPEAWAAAIERLAVEPPYPPTDTAGTVNP